MIPAECPWRDTLHWFSTIDSTNTYAKKLAIQGAPQGTVVIAEAQSAGRGRLGRTFHSPAGKGMYLSLILRPNCPAQELMHLTCAVGYSACNAVEKASGIRPGIKWINDLVLNKKKLGGILVELSLKPGSSLVDYAIIGIGINCLHATEDFPEELQNIATSLSIEGNHEISPAAIAAAVVTELWKTTAKLFIEKAQLMESYSHDCITLGQQIVVIRGDEKRYGTAVAIDQDGQLIVDFGGTSEAVSSGEVSIRGMYGYV